jgi:hypothetical protein
MFWVEELPARFIVSKDACKLKQKLIFVYLGALKWSTGETVAIKEIQLSNIPKAELDEIMVRSFADSRATIMLN